MLQNLVYDFMQQLRKQLDKIGRDPEITAKSVGLKYVNDSSPGYTRVQKGKGYQFLDDKNSIIIDKALLERFKKMVIPPAYTDVWICPYENGHLQFTGLDAAGRKQYRYHADWNKIRNQSKYHRMEVFASHIPKIREQIDADLARKNLDKQKVLALVVRVMELTHIRIGNDNYRELYGSYGLTTLQDEHVKIKGGTVKFGFKGKKGVYHDLKLESKKLAKLIKQCQDIPGQELFQYYDENHEAHDVTSGDVNTYLKEITGEDFTAKDFRTWSGSVHALYAFKAAGGFSTATECKKNITKVLDDVAFNLGNTRTVCKKYYVHPTLIKSYEEGRIDRYLEQIAEDKPLSVPGLNQAEKVLLELIGKEKIAEAL
ncbi:MAG: DNA topoisomerase IB [Janthinobacterium lividum]